jgi:hypothetical protein
MFPPRIRPRPAKSDRASVNKARMASAVPVIADQAIADQGKVSAVVDRADQEAPAASVVEDRAVVGLAAASAVVPEAAAN